MLRRKTSRLFFFWRFDEKSFRFLQCEQIMQAQYILFYFLISSKLKTEFESPWETFEAPVFEESKTRNRNFRTFPRKFNAQEIESQKVDEAEL